MSPMILRWILLLSLVLVLDACTAGGTGPQVGRTIEGNWQGLATGPSGSVEVLLALNQTENDLEAELFIPTIERIKEASGFGKVENSSFSLALTDEHGRSIFVTGAVDATGTEITGEIAVADDSDRLLFDLFKQ